MYELSSPKRGRYRRAVLPSAALVAASAGALACGIGAAAQPSVATALCTNPYSGARWTVRIDFSRRTVDSFPAKITRDEIAWREGARGGHYHLSRRSGELTALYASSTGGYALHYVCSIR